MCGPGGQTSTSTVTIPPEVLKNYQEVYARGKQIAEKPFQEYSKDPNAFVAGMTPTQQAALDNINSIQGMATGDVQEGQGYIRQGMEEGRGLQGESLGTAQRGQGIGEQLYGQSLDTSSGGLSDARQIYGEALPAVQRAAATGENYAQDAAARLYAGINQAQPYMGEAANLTRMGLGAGQQYAGMAGGYLGPGTQGVGPGAFNPDQYMSPYMNQVVRAQQALQAEENQTQRSALRGEAIRAGAFGGDRAGIAQANLARQQSLANQATLSNLLQQGYGQAQGVAGQQQQVDLGAAQANRAAQQFGAQQAAALGQQQFGQGLSAAQQQAALGQALYAQNIGQGQAIAGLGQQQYGQGVGSAQAAAGMGKDLYGMSAQEAQLQQAAAQGLFGQAAQVAALQQSAGNNVFNYGLQGGQGIANLGLANQQAQMQAAQAQMQMGQIQQQTDQAGKTAMYNQFTQQQGFPYQQAQFLGNLAMGTGALSGSTTTNQSSGKGALSDRRMKDNVWKIGETFDGQPIYRYNLKGDDRTQIGLMAQDVEKHNPDAVGRSHGYKTVDYEKATDKAAERGHFYNGGLVPASMGGAVSPEDAYGSYARGGYAGGGVSVPNLGRWTRMGSSDSDGGGRGDGWMNAEGEVRYGSDPNIAEKAAEEEAAKTNASKIDPRINQIYQDNLFRDADPEGEAYYQKQLDKGASYEDITHSIANSREKNLVNQTPLTYDASKFAQYAAPVRNRYGAAAAPEDSYRSSFDSPPIRLYNAQANGRGPSVGGGYGQTGGGYGGGYGQTGGGYAQQPMAYNQSQASGKGPSVGGMPVQQDTRPLRSGEMPAPQDQMPVQQTMDFNQSQASGKGPSAGSGYGQQMGGGYGQQMGSYGGGYGQQMGGYGGGYGGGYQQPSQMSQYNQGYNQGYSGGYQPMQQPQASGKGVGPSSYQSNYGYSNPYGMGAPNQGSYGMGTSAPQASGKGPSSSGSGGAQAFRDGGRIGYAGGGSHIDPNDLAAIASQRMMDLAPHAAGIPGQTMPGTQSYVSNKQLHVPKLAVSNTPPPRQEQGGLQTAMAHAESVNRLGNMFKKDQPLREVTDRVTGLLPQGAPTTIDAKTGKEITSASAAGAGAGAPAFAPGVTPVKMSDAGISNNVQVVGLGDPDLSNTNVSDAGIFDNFQVAGLQDPDLSNLFTGARGGLVPHYAGGGSLPYGDTASGGGYIPEELLQPQPIQSLPKDDAGLRAAGAKAASGGSGGLGDIMKAGNLGYKLAPESLKTSIKSFLPGATPATPSAGLGAAADTAPIAAANATAPVAEGLGAAAPVVEGLGATAPAAEGLGAALPAAAETAAAAAVPVAAEAAAGLGGAAAAEAAAAAAAATAASAAPIAATAAAAVPEGLAALLAFLPFFSDRRLKENIDPVGKTYDGQTIYRYNYKGEPATQIGLIAQEVEKRHKDAVGSYRGMKTVDYKRATEDAADRGHFYNGGLVPFRRGYADGMTVDEADLPAIGAEEMAMPVSAPNVERQENPLATLITRTAEKIGVRPVDLGTAISYETVGTFDPWKRGPTTKWGEHRGWIQMGEPQRKQYGVTQDSTPEQQMDAVGRYLVDRGVKPGMGLKDIYSAINAGRVGRYNASDAGAGGAPGTVADKVAGMGDHRVKAARLLGIDLGNTSDQATPRPPLNIPNGVSAYAPVDNKNPLENISTRGDRVVNQALAAAKQPPVASAPASPKKDDGSFPIRPPATARGKEQDWSDFLTSKQFILPALTAIATAATTPTRYVGHALATGLLGGLTSYQNLDKTAVELEQKKALTSETEQKTKLTLADRLIDINRIRAAKNLIPIKSIEDFERRMRDGTYLEQTPEDKSGATPQTGVTGAQPPSRVTTQGTVGKVDPQLEGESIVRGVIAPAAQKAMAQIDWNNVADSHNIPKLQESLLEFKRMEASEKNSDTLIKNKQEQAALIRTIIEITKGNELIDKQGNRFTPPGWQSAANQIEREKVKATEDAKSISAEETKQREFRETAPALLARFERVQGILEKIQTNPILNIKTYAPALAEAVGMSGEKYNQYKEQLERGDYEKFVKESKGLLFENLQNLGGRFLTATVKAGEQAVINPDIQPSANRALTAAGKGYIEYQMAFMKDYRDFKRDNPYPTVDQFDDFAEKWKDQNKVKTFVDRVEATTPVKGDYPNPRTAKDGWEYVMDDPATIKKFSAPKGIVVRYSVEKKDFIPLRPVQ